MPRKPFLCNPETPYHLSARANNREWFELPLEELWPIFEDYLYFIHHAFGVRIHAFVLMNNHFHLIASFPEGNLSEAMEYFMRETSRAIARALNRTNHVYGSRIFRSRLSDFRYFEAAYKYVLRNPVDAGMCDSVQSYPFSTLHGLIGLSKICIPVEEDTILFADVTATLQWLNDTPDMEKREDVKKALRRPDFKLPRGPTSKPNALESVRY